MHHNLCQLQFYLSLSIILVCWVDKQLFHKYYSPMWWAHDNVQGLLKNCNISYSYWVVADVMQTLHDRPWLLHKVNLNIPQINHKCSIRNQTNYLDLKMMIWVVVCGMSQLGCMCYGGAQVDMYWLMMILYIDVWFLSLCVTSVF